MDSGIPSVQIGVYNKITSSRKMKDKFQQRERAGRDPPRAFKERETMQYLGIGVEVRIHFD